MPVRMSFFEPEITEKRFQRRRKKAGMLRLEDKIIVLLRLEERDDLVAPRFVPQAMLHLPAKIGSPAAKIIVHINDRDAGFLGALFRAGEASAPSAARNAATGPPPENRDR